MSVILACAGLANNFSALKALSTDGIQKSHMKLHGRNIAVQAGVDTNHIDEVVDFMNSVGIINISTAKKYLESKNI